MEEQGYIELKISNIENTLSPKDIDISEIVELIADIETFLYPNRKEKQNRPKISYDIKEGSIKHKFYLPITAVILFNGLTNEINNRKNIDFLEYKRQEIIDKFQKKASKEGIIIEFINSISEAPTLIIDFNTNFQMIAPKYFQSEFYLHGEIYQEGGKTPNLHISTKKYGNLTISVTKEQIIDGEKKIYKPYGVKVRGKKSLLDNSLSDLELIEFVYYQPAFNQTLLDAVIQKATVNLSKISNVDTWLKEIKADEI
jgi:hypothetical protein